MSGALAQGCEVQSRMATYATRLRSCSAPGCDRERHSRSAPSTSPRRRTGMVIEVCGTLVYEHGKGTFRQEHPKTDASHRRIPVADFAADVVRRRLKDMGPDEQQTPVFHNRRGGVLSM